MLDTKPSLIRAQTGVFGELVDPQEVREVKYATHRWSETYGRYIPLAPWAPWSDYELCYRCYSAYPAGERLLHDEHCVALHRALFLGTP